jgi:cytochrome c peroxidase
MPDHLHRHGRRGVQLLQVGIAVLAAACTPGRSRAIDDASPAAVATDATGESGETEPTRLLRGYARKGASAAERLVSVCDDRPAYLELRRNAVASLSVWRRWIGASAEAAFGPEVAAQEAGGSIGALDQAIQAGACDRVRGAAENLRIASRVADGVLARREIPPARIGQALSDAAYRLGQAILESTPFVPEGNDAAFADVLGFLDFVEAGARALDLDVGAEVAALSRLRQARALSDVTDRAALVRATGVVGTAIRRALHARGVAANLMIRPLRDAADPSALTLPRPAVPVPPAQVALGRRVFHDPRLSPDGRRSCASCHVPEFAYADRLVAPASRVPGTVLRRNTPSLLYSPLAALLTWDGRVRTADRQALMVIHTRAELGLSDPQLVRVIASDPAYASGFRDAFGESVNAQDIGTAIAAFEAEALVPGTAPIDRFARGDGTALSTDARTGLDLFAGKGRCARCHVPPVFGGTRPPDFTAPVFAVLGVPSGPGAHAVDSDPGHDGAFKVPSVRNVGKTAPYFHHGRYASLEEVLDFYDRGGGRGLGLDVPNQDPEVRPLGLSADEKRALLVFMREALSDSP